MSKASEAPPYAAGRQARSAPSRGRGDQSPRARKTSPEGAVKSRWDAFDDLDLCGGAFCDECLGSGEVEIWDETECGVDGGITEICPVCKGEGEIYD